ncbi:RHS repeat-associated core domain-containing protein [Pseudoalteromonas sp. SMS1]|uniref:RHS repeat domain-containing protein n=1 Tax=Pseudoalteromonas sp. SMS1 TaxID=2908894 RepID=UPI001F1F7DC6|nr:RHS repeat-associated core domain-containing protein [Pseudoalteromonas sp. SMS1]MCF2858418.1 RHS repeat-associated core domain-containing protein [Pseudoalteromonas sp. SMS1]
MSVTTGSVGTQHSFSESYFYDDLHRLTANAIQSITTIRYSYDAMGNITSKSDCGSQHDYINSLSGHSGGGPNAVKKIYKTNGTWVGFSYDARGNMIQGDGLASAIYNAMDKPTSITKNGITNSFVYGPDHIRFKQTKSTGETRFYASSYEEEVKGGTLTWRAYVGDVAVISQQGSAQAVIRYTHRDRLGSARLFTDRNGKVIAERNFDPFGKPRQASDGLKFESRFKDIDKAKTSRGFTNHEHLDEMELIHMNGRVYDYNLGRFMSVDPFIHEGSQGINPYSYLMNNPLAGTDPTGYLPVLIIPIIEIGGGALALYGSWEAGQTIGNAINDFSSGNRSTSDVLMGAGKSLAIDAAMSVTGAKLTKLAPDSLTQKLKSVVNGNGAGSFNGSNGNIADLGSKNTDQDMVNNLIQKRRESDAPGEATFGQGRDGDGNLTPVRESIPGNTRAEDIHAETQVLDDLRGKPKPHTVAVVQNPCSNCSSDLSAAKVDKVIVPSKPSNPNGSPKSAAVSAAKKNTSVGVRSVPVVRVSGRIESHQLDKMD